MRERTKETEKRQAAARSDKRQREATSGRADTKLEMRSYFGQDFMDFDALTPDLVLYAVEQAFDMVLDGSITPYPSYINRVYGVRTDDGEDKIVKFYRPDRWSAAAIADEHLFLHDCYNDEVPVVPPIADSEGDTLHEIELDNDRAFLFALYEKTGGRNFDAENDDDWYRLGTLTARVHLAGRIRRAPARLMCHPEAVTRRYVEEILSAEVMSPEQRSTFEALCTHMIGTTAPLFEDLPVQRVHGDFHRGNILDRPDTGLLVFDFDDMMNGPPVQDLWLLLPDYAAECAREITMLIDGYEQFLPFDRRQLPLIEPLRFMRMIYFLAWQVRQRFDHSFYLTFPHWGSEAFWNRELEELRTQREIVDEQLR
ncbi:MAG: serine/threonine protein kinase [Spirochaetales bacterium]